ncbi:MAG: hypothetical protein KI793_01340 [Rivularia sp. (in: Bacteria)]|nr:hypothetical protein [Rivularia sp. MS3]
MSENKTNGNGSGKSNDSEKSEPKDLQVYEPVVLDDEKLGYFKTDVKGYEGDFIKDNELPSELKSEESQEETDS